MDEQIFERNISGIQRNRYNAMKKVLAILLTLTLLSSVGWAGGSLNYTPYSFTTLDVPAGAAAQFNHPGGVALDTNNNVYVADTYNGAIRKMTPSGSGWVVTTVATGLNYPYGVAVDMSNNVYVGDTFNNVVRKYTPSGTNWVMTTLAGSFANPTGVAVDTNGNVYVVEFATSVIAKVTAGGVVSIMAGQANSTGTNDGNGSAARFDYPNGLAVDSAGNVYVADSGNNTIRKITPGGMVSTVAGLARVSGGVDGTGSVARFSSPESVAVDGATNVYVADYDNDTIRRVTPAGVVTTLGGLLGLQGDTDATGINARFNLPDGVAVDSNGVVYVADEDNMTIRQGALFVVPPVIVITSLSFSGNQFEFNLTGPAGQTVVVQESTNLINWVSLWTNTLGSNGISFLDPRIGRFSDSFYRALTP
jgi:sugar lactone lactonase YvrE